MGQGRVFKRGAIWWMDYSAGGRRYRESADTTRKESAEALLRERLQKIWEGQHFPGRRVTKQLTLGKLRDTWLKERAAKKSIDDDEIRLDHAVEYFGEHRQIVTLTAEEISKWRDVMKDKGLATATINRHLAVLRSALNLAIDRQQLMHSPMRGVRFEKELNERDRLCSPAEFAKLRDAAEGDLRAAIVIGYWLGMRLGEIIGLTWDRIDTKAGTIRLRASDTKEAAAKVLPLPKEAVAELKALPKNIDGRVFRYRAHEYSRRFRELCGADAVKIADLHFHDLRHTAVTRMLESGLDLRTIQAFTGHKTLMMIKRYAKVTDVRLRDAMAAIEAHAARTARDAKPAG